MASSARNDLLPSVPRTDVGNRECAASSRRCRLGRTRHRGISLLELLVTTTVLAVLASYAVPSYQQLVTRNHLDTHISNLMAELAFARQHAVFTRESTLLCPKRHEAPGCGEDWANGTRVFADLNQNSKFDAGERLLHEAPGLRGNARLSWRSFRGLSTLAFTPRGYTAWQNGTFVLCPEDGNPREARLVTLNAQGRARRGRDRDRDGIPEMPSGRAVTCG